MRKRIRILTLVLMFVFISSLSHQPVTANEEVIATSDKLIVFKINDKNYYTQAIGSENVEVNQMDTAPIIHLDRTFVPVRFLGNALGVDDSNIEWNNNTRTATLRGNNKLDLTIDKRSIVVNDKTEPIDVAPMITNNRTMLPARYVAEGLGFKVDWDADNELVIVYQGKKPDVSAILAKIKNIEKPVKPKVETKVVDLGKFNGDFHEDYIKVADYNLGISNNGVSNPGIWFGIGDSTYPVKDIKVVCTSHPEWNKNNRKMWDGTRMIQAQDVWTNSFKFFKDGYSPVEPKSGDRITFDVYGKVDGAEVKLATITKTLPDYRY